MVEFVLFDLCFCLLLFMVLKLLCWLLVACLSFALLSVGWFGLVVSLLLMLVMCLVCWMGLLVVTFLFCVVWFRFRLFRRFLALWPSRVGRAYRLLDMVSEGCRGHGPVHFLVSSAAEIGFRWDPHSLAWHRPGLPLLSNLAGPVQHFRAAILDAWQNKVQLIFVVVRVFVVAPCWIFVVLCSFLTLLMSGIVIKVLLRCILVGGAWNGFLLSKVKGQPVPCRFCGAPDHDGHLFWDCPFPPLVEIRENPEFHDLISLAQMLALAWLAAHAFILLRVLHIWWRLLVDSTLLGWLLIGIFPMVFMLVRSLRSLVFLLLVLGCLFAHQSELCWSDRRWGHV